MSIRTFLYLFLVVLSQITLADTSTQKEKLSDIRLLLEITGADKHLETISDAYEHTLLVYLMQSNKNISKEHIGILKSEIEVIVDEYSRADNGFYDRAINLYDQTFSHSEIKDLLVFYRSDTGKKALKEQSFLNKRLYAFPNEWDAQNRHNTISRIKSKLQSEGLNVDF